MNALVLGAIVVVAFLIVFYLLATMEVREQKRAWRRDHPDVCPTCGAPRR